MKNESQVVQSEPTEQDSVVETNTVTREPSLIWLICLAMVPFAALGGVVIVRMFSLHWLWVFPLYSLIGATIVGASAVWIGLRRR